MEGVRISRWLLAFPSTFRLWRRMKLWELRSYEEVIRMEQDRLVYETRLRARYGRSWRRKAPVEALMPLKLTRYGVPLHRTAPQSTVLPEPEPIPLTEPEAPLSHSHELATRDAALRTEPTATAHEHTAPPSEQATTPVHPPTAQEPAAQPAAVQPPEPTQPVPTQPDLAPSAEPSPPATEISVPVAPGRYRALANPEPGRQQELFVEPTPAPQQSARQPQSAQEPQPVREPEPEPEPEPVPESRNRAQAGSEDEAGDADMTGLGDEPVGIPDAVPRDEYYFEAYRQYIAAHASFPTARQLSRSLYEAYGVTSADGSLLSETYLGGYMREFKDRYNAEMGLVD
jgi:hypothetical protein